jgi:hypothetical protein
VVELRVFACANRQYRTLLIQCSGRLMQQRDPGKKRPLFVDPAARSPRFAPKGNVDKEHEKKKVEDAEYANGDGDKVIIHLYN